jgi:hypothetical protein
MMLLFTAMHSVANGTKQTFDVTWSTSAFRGKAVIAIQGVTTAFDQSGPRYCP